MGERKSFEKAFNRFPWPEGRGSLFLASRFASSPVDTVPCGSRPSDCGPRMPEFFARNKVK